ncbi:MAG: hypothetical protein U1E51_21090 [Candidatus Binatia bacterium]|nr:hypothetical protein [Candidatus Binatia bacterium]
MSPELLSRFEPVAREQLKQVVTNRVSQFFTADSFKIEGRDPLVIRFLYAPRRDATMLDPTPLPRGLLKAWGKMIECSGKVE